ncbi:phytochromobilin:ferredoxin oxidoreductase, chloroplastic isoform X2 [Tanacetum coccineum]
MLCRKLLRLVKSHGKLKWAYIAEQMIDGAGKQCRERPDIKILPDYNSIKHQINLGRNDCFDISARLKGVMFTCVATAVYQTYSERKELKNIRKSHIRAHKGMLLNRIEVVTAFNRFDPNGKTECCDVVASDGMDVAKIKLRDCELCKQLTVTPNAKHTHNVKRMSNAVLQDDWVFEITEEFSNLKAVNGKTKLKMCSFQAPKIRLLCSLSIASSDGVAHFDGSGKRGD